MCKEIYLDAPNVGNLEKQYLNEAIDNRYVSTFGPYISKFEEKFARYLGMAKAVSTQSGTAALHIALHELDIGKGDEVIVPALTFVATVNPITYVGATPVFVDIDSKTWNINPTAVEEKITGKTKAIIPVHLYGNPCNMDEIIRIAKENNLYVVEDATESLGATYKKKQTGTLGHFGCFSFNGNKLITTGGGGMVTTNDQKRAEHIEFLVNQAKDISNGNYHPEIGFNYRMTNIEAALGLAQMERLEEFLGKKKKFNTIYKERLKSINSIDFQKEYKGAGNSYWLSCIIFKERIDISSLQQELKDKGIATRRIFTPLTEFPPYKMYKIGNYEKSHYVYERGLCLPSSTLNSEDAINYVCETIKELV